VGRTVLDASLAYPTNEGNRLFVDDNRVIFIVQADNSATGALPECSTELLVLPLNTHAFSYRTKPFRYGLEGDLNSQVFSLTTTFRTGANDES
jgi:hypothetical protein